MSREQIIAWAREAGIHVYPEFEASFERFANLVAEAVLHTSLENKPVAWMLRTGHGTAFREGDEPQGLVPWTPLYSYQQKN